MNVRKIASLQTLFFFLSLFLSLSVCLSLFLLFFPFQSLAWLISTKIERIERFRRYVRITDQWMWEWMSDSRKIGRNEKKCFYVTMMKENDNDDDNISILHECACFGFPRDSLSVYLPENYTKACAYVYFLLCQYYYVAYCFAKVACKKHFSYGDTREKRLHKE